jgi:putative addiction module killer protein
MGNPGEVKPVGEGVSEMRIDYGPGYRIYFKQRGQELIILLAGGDKRILSKDIHVAYELSHNIEIESTKILITIDIGWTLSKKF